MLFDPKRSYKNVNQSQIGKERRGRALYGKNCRSAAWLKRDRRSIAGDVPTRRGSVSSLPALAVSRHQRGSPSRTEKQLERFDLRMSLCRVGVGAECRKRREQWRIDAGGVVVPGCPCAAEERRRRPVDHGCQRVEKRGGGAVAESENDN